ncbi:MAG: NPCBM/NEW2 domain-containing protein, partial [Clostridia bacterium]|nr:NPCBM/NEW2 domain-containing protein [Clostridia bacterium]
HSVSVGKGYITFLLNYKYDKFEGTVASPKGEESDSYRTSATLTIYGDGDEIAVFRDFSDTSRPQDFSIDVSPYEKVTLSWSCKGSNIWEDWGYFATIFDGVFIPVKK